ncbi:delta-60 repeat domain-containing protein [Flavobacterium piscinae]|uniref:hypothetical protein n=1 Tax=Flavobacterium piscinae TaxID=2506424 RepID=UPI001992366F|nr:hypothetical protein [Flavobacterium piscinae]MBC8883158.1 delta-60 repeat domain-containing protein [Flavobacterium piscinae]
MKIKIIFLLIVLSTSIKAQNAADIDLVLGSGYIGFNDITVIKVQPDGKIVVGGNMKFGPQSSTWEGRVARFNPDGTIDTSFEEVILLTSGVINDIALQTDGKILVCGNFSTLNGEAVSQIIRLHPDGTKDTSFVPTIGGAINSIALQPDGKIMIAGSPTTYINEHIQRYVLRLNADGTTDHSFDFGFPGFPGVGTALYKVTIQPDGKIFLAAGFFNAFNGQPQGRIIRFNSDGSKDNSFDVGTGALSSNGVNEIIVQPDGKILVGGGFNSWNGQATGSLCRLNNDGSLDQDFFGNTKFICSSVFLTTRRKNNCNRQFYNKRN